MEAMSVALLEVCGLLPFGGEDSVRFVRGVRPLASEAFLL